jgi:Xaa-Pro aminopeptidase
VALEEAKRGLNFEYCLTATGPSAHRIPNEAVWAAGQVLSLDSGGNLHGYIGDLTRMSVRGQPTSEMADLLAQVDAVQMAARRSLKPGALGQEVIDAANRQMAACESRQSMDFVAHGMGLITHEAPRLTTTGPVPYAADHASRPLEAGMVVSIETTILSQRIGIVKLEDTVAVTADGWEAYGDVGRGWNPID